MSCGIGRRHGSDLVLLWLWCRPVATVPIRSLARELPYAAVMGLKSPLKKKKNLFFKSLRIIFTECLLCARKAVNIKISM